ncbi:MAG: hypothetical protein WBK91_03475 [Alphaproteobacteria bacterium]
MSHQPLFRHIALTALCIFTQNAIAQDVMVKPTEGGAASAPSGTSWFSIFSPSKEGAGNPADGDAARALSQATENPGAAPLAPGVDISNLPPETQKAYREAMHYQALQKKNQDYAGSILKKPDMSAFQALETPSLPDLEGLNIPEETRRQYLQETKKMADKIKSLQEASNKLKPVEVTMPDPGRNHSEQKFDRQLSITMTGDAKLTAEDTKAVSAFFEIPAESVRQLCDLKVFARAMANSGYNDAGEEIRGGRAVANYNGEAPKVSFESFARCKLNNISENVLLRIKEHDRYLYRLGLSDCQAPDNAKTPTSLKAEYLGGGKVSCNF